MADRVQTLISQALALRTPRNPQRASQEAEARRLPLGCPPELCPGTEITDPVTGQKGVILAYGRTAWLRPPAGEGDRGGSPGPPG